MARLLRIREVAARVGLSETTIKRLRRTGAFPEPVRITVGTVGWAEDVIDRWIDERSSGTPAGAPALLRRV